VKKIHAEEESLHNGRVNRYTRSALNGQKAVIVEFPINEDGFTTELASDVEKELSVAGRHTYLYRAKAGEPVADILKHLHHAGVIVLLAVDTTIVDTTQLNTDETYFSDLREQTDLSVEGIAEYIKAISMYSAGIFEQGAYI
jgi:sulfate adenylyltransferase subunit 1